MKIQSSLLVLAAMVGSATAANKRKRVFKIYSREEIQAAEATRSLQGGGGKNQGGNNKDPAPEAVPAVMSMSMTLSPSGSPIDVETIITSAPTATSMMTKCAFCHGKVMPNPDLDLGVQSQTCGSVKMFASSMDATNANCALAKQAEVICCPPVVETTTTTTTATTAAAMMSMPTTTEAADIVETETTTTATEAASVPATPTPPSPTPPSPAPDGAPSGAMTMETTLAALTVVAGAMMLV
mmetsp:Transcript_21774/g.32970  ORF Transcript_21774/g.32970 Transcript_21774/m.32970 type:complete len:240 (-) Transcript_21774:179-898(-)